MKPITRARALELAQECIRLEMDKNYVYVDLEKIGILKPKAQKNYDRYIELAAALAYIENLARQKELL